MTQKNLDQCFADWESYHFGFGYGTGEQHIFEALKKFMDTLFSIEEGGERNSYRYTDLENELGAQVTWLLINFFGRTSIIEYGSSARFGWLTSKGKNLKRYLDKRSVSELVDLKSKYYSQVECFENHSYKFATDCQCEDQPCNNPFFANDLNYEEQKIISNDPRWNDL